MLNGNAIEEAKAFLGLDKTPLSIHFVEGNKESSVHVKRKGDSVTISYDDISSCFYGLTLLKEHIEEEEFVISKNRHFDYNGSMFDCSRNEVLNLKTIKEIILVSALMGLNRFLLYTEDVYEIEGEPFFGYCRGRYTKEEIKEIVNYSKGFGVDIIPCIQMLSHLNQALRWSAYGKLKDSQNTLNIECEDIYALLEKMIETCRENFESDYIHIGMDEAGDLGLRAFLSENRLIDKKEYFLKHLNKVVALCKKHHFKPMMWIDMFFKIDPKAKPDWYDLKGKLDESIKKEIPDVELVYWNYYDYQTSRYDENIKTSLDTGKEITFASGLIRWIGMITNITPSLRKCQAGLKMARKHNLKSVFATTWGDSQSCCTALTLYTILALHSAFDYGDGKLSEVSSLLKTITGLSLKDWVKLELPNHLTENELLPFENPSFPFLFQDPLLGLFDTRAKVEFEDAYHQRYLLFKRMAKKAERFGYIYKTESSLCDLLSVKVTLGKKMRDRYKKVDLEGLRQSIKDINLTLKKLEAFSNDFSYQWHQENKVFGFEIIDGRFGYLKQRLLTARKLLNQFLNKEISSIPELEETILPYDGAKDDEAHCYNVWKQIVTVGDF